MYLCYVECIRIIMYGADVLLYTLVVLVQTCVVLSDVVQVYIISSTFQVILLVLKKRNKKKERNPSVQSSWRRKRTTGRKTAVPSSVARLPQCQSLESVRSHWSRCWQGPHQMGQSYIDCDDRRACSPGGSGSFGWPRAASTILSLDPRSGQTKRTTRC